MEACHDHLHESHNLPEGWIMIFWERGCSSAWTLLNKERNNQLMQEGQTTNTQAKFIQDLFYHRGTKALETVCNKTKLQFCIEKDSKKAFSSAPLESQIQCLQLALQDSALWPFQARRTLDLKARNPPEPHSCWRREFYYCIPTHIHGPCHFI